jgi:prepilin-type N-terminal cleavage/methylation domain-containing protein
MESTRMPGRSQAGRAGHTFHVPASSRRRSAFTLIELLVVVAIILILAGLLFPALMSALNKSRRMAALAEVKGIETAWKKYYQEYTGWPTLSDTNNSLQLGGANAFLVNCLRGADAANNPKQLVFMDFFHTNSVSDPYNPWGSRDAALNTVSNYYYVKFDTDFDNVIPAATGSDPLPNPQPSAAVRASVLVWTYDPTAKTSAMRVIGSWQR